VVRRDFACSFCGKARREARKLVTGPRVFICEGCIDRACEQMKAASDAAPSPWFPFRNRPAGHELVEVLALVKREDDGTFAARTPDVPQAHAVGPTERAALEQLIEKTRRKWHQSRTGGIPVEQAAEAVTVAEPEQSQQPATPRLDRDDSTAWPFAQDARDTRTLLAVAETFARRGKIDEATERYWQVADLYEEQGFVQKAVAVLKNIEKLAPRDPRAARRLAALFRSIGMIQDAIAAEERATRLERETGTPDE